MDLLYGVLRGRPDRFKREDNASTPHLQIRVLENGGQPWRIAVNVQSSDKSNVAFWIVDPLMGEPVLASLAGLASGFTTAAPNADHALDYVKAPLFDFPLGRMLPPTGQANGDDLQDLLSLYLDQCKAAGGEVYAFGAKFDRNLHKPIDAEFGNLDGLHGIHDIHMNQGNVGTHAGDNGVFHDGGLILKFPDRFLGLFLGFQTQLVPTDGAGNAAPGSMTVGQIISGGPSQGGQLPGGQLPGGQLPGGQLPVPTPMAGTVYMAHALINPAGTDPGREVIVLASLSTSTQSISNWRLLDKNGRVTKINATLAAGAFLAIALDGSGVQLGNNGGNLILQDQANAQVDAVTYTGDDASVDNRYVRFRR